MSAVRTSTVCLVVALLLAGCGQQTETESREMVAAPELIPRAEIFGNPDKALVRISPDGSKISYVAAVDGVLNVWVGPADDPSAARAVTHDTYRGIRRYNWAQTNNHIVYLQDKGGDENWRAHSVDLTSGEEKDLTPMEGIRAEIMRISHLHPEEILVGINDRDERLHDVYRIDLTSGERTLVEENPGYAEYLADDHYNVRFAFDMTDDGGMDCLRKKSDGGYEPFMSIGMEDMLTTQPFEFDKSGERLFMIDSRERNTAALYALDIASGEKTLLYENPLADVSDGLMHPTEKTFEAVASTYERKKWLAVLLNWCRYHEVRRLYDY